MSREVPDGTMDESLAKIIKEEMKPYVGKQPITFSYTELDELLYDTLETGYCQGAEDWIDG